MIKEPAITPGEPASAHWTRDYERVVDETLRKRMRFVVGIGSFIYLLYSVLDHQVYPDFAREFAWHRLVISLLLLGIAAYSYVKSPPVRAIWFLDLAILLTTGHIAYMIFRTDGVSSSYYQGISVCLMAMASVNTFYVKHAVGTGLVIYGLYLAAVALNPVDVTAPALLPPLFFMGSTIFFVAVLARLYGRQHYDQHRYATRLVENERLKDEFFANVSHELRTPLALVLGPVRRLLGGSGADSDARADLATIERNAVTLLRHVNQILDLSKLDAGMLSVAREAVDLAALVRFVSSHFDVVAAERSIAFEVDAPPELEAATDREKVERILFNLLSNAFKYVPKGGKVAVRLEARPGQIRLSVIDDGPGVPAAMRETIFERFRQVDGGTTRRHGGTGLGLAIVREFATLLGGRVRVDQAVPHGAIFVLDMPLVAVSEAVPAEPRSVAVENGVVLADEARSEHPTVPPVATPELEKTGEPSGAQAKILVVEDHSEMGRFLTSTLAPLGRITLAVNGADAVRKAHEIMPDLVVTDVMMPEMSGSDLVTALKQSPVLADVPILMLTAKADESFKIKLLAAGVQDYMHKPFLAEELIARAKNLVAMKHVRDILSGELQRSQKDLVAMARDLAASKKTAEGALAVAEAASRSKDEFLLNLSHELRTPLTAILGWSELLEAKDEGFEPILRNARSMLRLVDDLLDLARIAQGKLRLELAPTPLAEPVAASLAAVEATAQIKGVRLDLPPETAEALKTTVVADKDRLQQVMWNLVSNAVKFTPRGGRVSVGVKVELDQVEIAVSDTGQGVDPEFLPRMFERFQQEDLSFSRAHGGMGLGLAITRHLVEMHGGRIGASSPGPGMGSLFTVTLPRTGPASLH